MSDDWDRAIELVVSELGGVVLPEVDLDDEVDQHDRVVMSVRRRRRGRKKDEVPPGQGGLF